MYLSDQWGRHWGHHIDQDLCYQVGKSVEIELAMQQWVGKRLEVDVNDIRKTWKRWRIDWVGIGPGRVDAARNI
jgi:hypothetical protein